MIRRAARWLLAGTIAVGVGVGVLQLTSDPQPAEVVDMAHGRVVFKPGELDRTLNAAAVASNAATEDSLAARGRMLFRSSGVALSGESCQSCHTEGSASPALGTIPHTRTAGQPPSPSNFDGPRDPPALWGIARTAPFFWNGDVSTLRAALIRPVKNHFKEFSNGPCSGAAADGQECVTKAGEIAAALEAYLRRLDPPVTAFDQGTMTATARRGEHLFQTKAGCIECHGGPLFTDNLVHDTGVPQVMFTNDVGDVKLSNDKGAPAPPVPAECKVLEPPLGCEGPLPFPGSAFINTPQLRDVRSTAPYMHNGALKTLRDVVLFYDRSSAVSPLHLTDPEIDDLVAYLESL